MRLGNFNAATQTLKCIGLSFFRFGPLSHQVQFRPCFMAITKQEKTDEALATIDRFTRLNPNHSDVDYAIYMRGPHEYGSGQ